MEVGGGGGGGGGGGCSKMGQKEKSYRMPVHNEDKMFALANSGCYGYIWEKVTGVGMGGGVAE